MKQCEASFPIYSLTGVFVYHELPDIERGELRCVKTDGHPGDHAAVNPANGQFILFPRKAAA